jgi:hypothetical protein
MIPIFDAVSPTSAEALQPATPKQIIASITTIIAIRISKLHCPYGRKMFRGGSILPRAENTIPDSACKRAIFA